MLRYILVTIVVAGLLTCAAGCSKEQEEGDARQAEQTEQTEQVEQVETDSVLITVNGESVTDEDIATEVSRLMQVRARGLNPQELESTRRALRTEAAGTVVNRMLLKQKVEKLGIEVPEAKVKERVQQIRENFGSEEVFKARIARMGMTEDDVHREIADALSMEQLIEEKTADLPEPSEKDLENYYNEHIDWYTEPEKMRASHILITVNPADDDQVRAEKLAGAQEVLVKAKGGANFAQLAVEHSECPSKSRGGDLDFFARGQMVKEFETAAFALEAGEISDIVETKFGYHIIKATDHKEGRVIPVDEVVERVKTDYGNEMKQKSINDYFDILRDGAKIVYNDSTLID